MAPIHETSVEVTSFLARHHPFSTLTAAALETLASAAEIEYFPAGETILVQAGAPAEHLYVVRRGSVELLDDAVVVDVLEEGESFGHPSALAGTPPAFTARAAEDTLVYLFPGEVTLAALSSPSGVRFLAATLEERLERAAQRTVHPTPLATSRARDRARATVVCEPETPIREAAARMTEAEASGIVVPSTEGRFQIVTDHDLRAQVLAGPVDLDAPLAALAPTPAHVADAETLAFDVFVDMLAEGVDQAVVVGAGGGLVGVVELSSLLDVDTTSPVAIRRAIDRAESATGVAEAVRGLPSVGVRLLDANVAPLEVLAALAAATDAATRRLIALTIADLGEPPVPWAWLAFGSEARREQTLATDQDNGLAYDGDADGGDVDSYFARFAERVTDGLTRCGYAECRAGVMASNPAWRLSRRRWLEVLDGWLRGTTSHDVHMAMIAADFRQVAGQFDIESELDQRFAAARERPWLIDRVTRASTESRPPLGFLRDLVVERSGDHVGTLDIKAAGTVPVVDLARRHAFAAGSVAKGTVDRLRAAARLGALEQETALELEEAFTTICRVRLEHQAAQVERDTEPDNHVDPRELAPLARRQLKEAFRAVARAQHSLDTRVATRIP